MRIGAWDRGGFGDSRAGTEKRLEGLLGAEQVRGSEPERITVLLRLSAKEANGKDTVSENHLALEPAPETESESCIVVDVWFACVREDGEEGNWAGEIETRSQKKLDYS